MKTITAETVLSDHQETKSALGRWNATRDLKIRLARPHAAQSAMRGIVHPRNAQEFVRALALALALLAFFCWPARSATPPIEKANQPSPNSPADSADYVNCPADIASAESTTAGVDIACSESLMDPHEVSDILGKRIANTYLVVEVKVRNLSGDYEYLLHDIRLGYKGVAVTSRDKKLVRGVAEKGQLLDGRNVFIRFVESAGSLGGSLSTFSFATVALKNALNVFQGPFTSAVKGFLPDFTVNQMTRLDDNGFTVQTMVVPKRSSVSVVTFLSREIFLNHQERKETRLSVMHRRSRSEGETLLHIQKKLVVEIAGAHVAEVNTGQPTATKIAPATAKVGAASLTVELLGQNLDRATSIRIVGESGNSTSGPLSLIDSDTAWAKATIASVPKQAGTYHVYLETQTGQEVDTNQTFTVTN
jgi:hypothetical protein